MSRHRDDSRTPGSRNLDNEYTQEIMNWLHEARLSRNMICKINTSHKHDGCMAIIEELLMIYWLLKDQYILIEDRITSSTNKCQTYRIDHKTRMTNALPRSTSPLKPRTINHKRYSAPLPNRKEVDHKCQYTVK